MKRMYEFLDNFKAAHCKDCDVTTSFCITNQDFCTDDMINAYKQGRDDREKEVLTYLVRNGYIKYGFDEEYLAERIKEQSNG